MASSSSNIYASINSQTSSSSSSSFMTGPPSTSDSFTTLLSSDNYNNNNMDSSSISWGLGSYDHHDRLLLGGGGGGGGFEFSNKFKSFTPSSLPLSPPPVSPSSFLSFPPALSPTDLLDSPVIFSSSNALASPTTGGFACQNFNWKNNSVSDNNQEQKSSFSDFSFQHPQSRLLTTSSSSATSLTSIFQSSSNIVSGQESTKVQQESWNFNKPTKQTDFLSEKTGVKTEFAPMHNFSSEMVTLQANKESTNCAGPQQSYNQHNQSSQYVRENRRSDDGYNWRKYGQKQVKGSENPRSYYKCTHPNCPTKKKVETSLDGQITEIVYKGSHNHPKPQSTRRSSSHSIQPSLCNNSEISDQSVAQMEDSSISIGEDEFDKGSPISNTGGDDQDENESDAKRWKGHNDNENILPPGSRTVREPRVVVQTTSDIDILDDGYRWRKYGQKVVKGNPNPRSYYKCTSIGCPVRKHVERASHDTRAVITTYEGKHNHDVPAARGSGYALSKPQPSTSGSNAPIPIRPSVVSTHSNHTSYPNSLHTTRLPTSGSQAPFTLEMLQNPSGSFGFSGFGRQAGTYTNQQNYTENVFSGAKEEPKDDSYLDSFLS